MPVAALKVLESPLLFTDEVFEKLVVAEGKSVNDVFHHVLTVCKEEINLGGTVLLEKLPLLTEDNLTTIQDGTIVRYRCMIQDMREPEFFLSSYSTFDSSKQNSEKRHCSLWRETVAVPDGHEYVEDSAGHETNDRLIFVGGSNPAETVWVKKYGSNDHNSKDHKVGASNRVSTGQCILKVYQDVDNLKLNDFVEFIGIYYSAIPKSEESDNTIITSSENPNNRMEATSGPAGNCLPCLHVLHYTKLRHCHPELALPNSTNDDSAWRNYLIRTLQGNVQGFRTSLINFLNQYLFRGDELASEYFLCHLMSAVYARQATMAVGQFSLSLFNIKSLDCGFDWVTQCLCPVMENLLAQVTYLPLSLSMLNGCSLVSRKCFQTDRLISGRLQLAKGTHLIIDETKLEIGQVSTQGINNIAALKSLIKWQKLDYDFTYHTCEFSTDMRVLVCSEGPSILPSDFALPIRLQFGHSELSNKFSIFDDADFVKAARVYFALAPLLSFTIEEFMQTRIQEDFVVMRRDSNGDITGDDLHRLLTLARMLSLSSGDSLLRTEIWEKAVLMEKERSERLKK